MWTVAQMVQDMPETVGDSIIEAVEASSEREVAAGSVGQGAIVVDRFQ